MMSANDTVPCGAPCHASAGERFSPSHECLTGMAPPSAKPGLESSKPAMWVSRNRSDVDDDEAEGIVAPEHVAHDIATTTAIWRQSRSFRTPPVAMRIGVRDEPVKLGAPGCGSGQRRQWMP